MNLCKQMIKKRKHENGFKRPLYSAFEHGFKKESLPNKLGRYYRGIRRSIQRIRYGYDEVATWDIDGWFLNVVPNIIHELRVNAHGYPTSMEGATDAEKAANWTKILRRMEFLFREANVNTCKRKNPYEAEYDAAFAAFTREYDVFGQKLKTKEDIEMEKAKGCCRVYTMSDVGGYYAEIQEKYMEELLKIDKYRAECLKKGMKLFTRHLWDLWD